MGHCSYNTNHWPCTYCEAPNPKHVDAKCRNEEELYCPLCGEKVFLDDLEEDGWWRIACNNEECLFPEAYGKSLKEVIAKWLKYAR